MTAWRNSSEFVDQLMSAMADLRADQALMLPAAETKVLKVVERLIDRAAAALNWARCEYYVAVRVAGEEGNTPDAQLHRDAAFGRIKRAQADLALGQAVLRQRCAACAERERRGDFPRACGPEHGRLLRLD